MHKKVTLSLAFFPFPELSRSFILDINATFRCIVSKMKKEQKENKANEEKTSGDLSTKNNELKSEIEEIKSDMSKMREELAANMDAMTNILSAFQKPGV